MYGARDFASMRTRNGYYVDKTQDIEKIENRGSEILFFLRPRRFGKTLFLSTLEYYYDINAKSDFERLFGDLYIGKNPTPLRNSYPTLLLDFSAVSSGKTLDETISSFNTHIRSRINNFFMRYAHTLNIENIFTHWVNETKAASDMLGEFLDYLNGLNLKLYLLIDEYDNFANNLLTQHGKDSYYKITHGSGFLREFFNVIKSNSKVVDRMFATGVTPLVLTDVTSGFNIGINISVDPDYHELVGFTETDVKEIVDYHIEQGLISETIKESLLYTIKKYYDGYLFSHRAQKSLYNTTAVWYIIRQFHTESNKNQKYELPDSVIDKNLMTDYQKLDFLVIEKQKLNGNYRNLSKLLLKGECKEMLVNSFSVKDLTKSSQFTSLLYYLGLITINEKKLLTTTFIIPNEACRFMLWEYIRTALNTTLDVDFSELAAIFLDFAIKGQWKPYFKKIFTQAYAALSNRDFTHRESVIKGLILGYLTHTNLYVIRSEKELNKGYTDLYLKPLTKIYPTLNPTHYLIELKYLKSDELTKANKEKQIETAKAAAVKQLKQYAQGLKLTNEPITKLIIIASNKELLLLEEIS